MFEIGMSSLVLKICSEYAKALGLNFPPCVQQEINAIAQYVDLHTVKDLKVEQDGSVVTITCFTEGEQEKVFTVQLPEINIDTLSVLLKGSSSVVVDKSEDGRTLVVRLDKSQEVQSIRIYNPQEPLSAEQLAILKANQENYILLYGSSIYKLQSAYVRDENTCVYSSTDLSDNGTAGITNVVVNMTSGEWDTESSNLQNDIIYVELSPSTATQGTITSSQWDILEKDKSNCIILNNEIYRLSDNQHTAGIISYVHTGWDNNIVSKSINITVSTRAWTMVKGESNENFVKAFTIPNGVSTGTLTADVKAKLCNPDGHNYYVYDDTSEMILKYSFNSEDEIIQYKAIYINGDKAYDITMQILPSNGSWRRTQTVLSGGKKLYKHYTTFFLVAGQSTVFAYLYSISSTSTSYSISDINEIANKFISGFHKDSSTFYPITSVITNSQTLIVYYIGASGNELQVTFENILSDTATEL